MGYYSNLPGVRYQQEPSPETIELMEKIEKDIFSGERGGYWVRKKEPFVESEAFGRIIFAFHIALIWFWIGDAVYHCALGHSYWPLCFLPVAPMAFSAAFLLKTLRRYYP